MITSLDDFDLRPPLARYAQSLVRGADDDDPDKRNVSTAERYLQDLRWYDSWLDENGVNLSELSLADAEELGFELSKRYNGSTAKNRWRVIHKAHQYLDRRDVLDANPLESLNEEKSDLFGFSSITQQSRELDEDEEYAVSEPDIREMEKNARRPRIRNQLIIRLMWQTGLRAGEVVGLRLDDLSEDNRTVTVRAANAKNDKKRVVPFQPSLDGLLRKWLHDGYRNRFHTAEDSEHLFLTRLKPQMTPDALEDVVKNAARDAGINRVLYIDAQGGKRWKITPHNIRHGFGSYLVHKTDASLFEVSRLMGHSSVKITEEKYIEHDPEAGLEAGREFGPD